MNTFIYKLSILFLMVYLPSTLYSQPYTVWTMFAGGSSDDAGIEVKTTDGGYIIVGWTDSYGAGGRDVLLIKASSDGNQIWEKTFGGSQDDEGQSVIKTSDYGYMMVGYTESYGSGGTNLWLIKTDGDGNLQWEKTLGEIENYGKCKIHQTLDGGYIIAGTTPYGSNAYDIRLIKTDSNGNVMWFKDIGSSVNDVCYSMKITSDYGYIICGYRYVGFYNWDALLIKTDSNGNVEWEKTFGSTNLDWAEDVSQTLDGGYIITGTVTRTDTYQNIWLIKTDASGVHQWDTNFGGDSTEGGRGVKQTIDGGYIIIGFTESDGIPGSPDIWIIKTNFEGTSEWREIVGGQGDDYGLDVVIPEEGVYIFTGMYTLEGHNQCDLILGKVTDIVNINSSLETPIDFALYQNFPNPFNPSTKIKYSIQQLSNVVIKVFDVLGNEMGTLVNEEKPSGTYELTWYAEELPSGVYFYQLRAGDFIQSRKMILLK